MRFTRKIPGIRPQMAGESAGADRPASPWPDGVLMVCVFVALIAVPIGMWVCCFTRADACGSLLWLAPGPAGLSNYALLSTINLLVVLLLLGSALISEARGTRPRIFRIASTILALGLLGVTQMLLNAWRDTAQHFLDADLAYQREIEEKMSSVREGLAALGSHPWAGEYVGGDGEWTTTCLCTPDGRFLRLQEGPFAWSDAHPARRACDRWYFELALRFEGNRMLLSPYAEAQRRTILEYLLVPWGERRYLVLERAFPRFQQAAKAFTESGVEVPLDNEILLRVGDESRPVAGLPTLDW